MSAAAEQLFGTDYVVIERYVDILISRGIDWGLLGPREADRIWDRHVLNSVAIAGLVAQGSTVADVGSGAGLPGIPLAILRPDLQVTLIEPLLRRSGFLDLVVDELGLSDRVTVVRARAEDCAGPGHPRFGTVTSRALAPLAKLVGWCWPLVERGGQIVAIKGQSAGEEIERDRRELANLGVAARVVGCSVAGSDDVAYAVVVT